MPRSRPFPPDHSVFHGSLSTTNTNYRNWALRDELLELVDDTTLHLAVAKATGVSVRSIAMSYGWHPSTASRKMHAAFLTVSQLVLARAITDLTSQLDEFAVTCDPVDFVVPDSFEVIAEIPGSRVTKRSPFTFEGVSEWTDFWNSIADYLERFGTFAPVVLFQKSVFGHSLTFCLGLDRKNADTLGVVSGEADLL